MLSSFSFFTGDKPPSGKNVEFQGDSLSYSEEEKPLRVLPFPSEFPAVDGFIVKPLKKDLKLYGVLPEAAMKNLKFQLHFLEDEPNSKKPVVPESLPWGVDYEFGLSILQKGKGGPDVVPLPNIWYVVSDDYVDYFPLVGQYRTTFDWSLPISHFMNPLGMGYLKQFLWFSFSRKEIQEHFLKVPSPYPIWERFEKHYMCRGIFYPTYKMRSLTFRGTGEIKYIKLMNYTPKPVKFQWVVPDKWKKKIGWQVNGKLVHELDVTPTAKPREVEISAFVDPAVAERDELLSTLVIAKGLDRIEWFPIPLLPNREEGEFFLNPKDVNSLIE